MGEIKERHAAAMDFDKKLLELQQVALASETECMYIKRFELNLSLLSVDCCAPTILFSEFGRDGSNRRDAREDRQGIEAGSENCDPCTIYRRGAALREGGK